MRNLVDECKKKIKSAASRVVQLPSSSRKPSSSSLDYDITYSAMNVDESDPKKRKSMDTPLGKAFKNEAREQCDGEMARLFYTSGLSFNVARNPHYHNSYVRA